MLTSGTVYVAIIFTKMDGFYLVFNINNFKVIVKDTSATFKVQHYYIVKKSGGSNDNGSKHSIFSFVAFNNCTGRDSPPFLCHEITYFYSFFSRLEDFVNLFNKLNF
jgi:hypothetical protein